MREDQEGDGTAPVPGPDEFVAAGLYDPDEPDADRRLELLQFLTDLGATVDDMLEVGDALPVLALVLPLRGGGERIPLSELARRTDLTTETLAKIWMAAGFPHPGETPTFGDEEVAVMQTLSAGMAMLGDEAVVQMVRAMGNATSRVAEAAASMYIVSVGQPALTDDPVGLNLARANAAAAQLIPVLERAMLLIFRRHMAEIRHPPAQILASEDGSTTQQVAVGFVDLVDSTGMGSVLGPSKMAQAFTSFEAEVSETVVANGGRLVKMIGDEAMFVTPDPVSACEIALDLARSFDSHPVLPQVRSGLAHGGVAARHGDFYGPVVTLAARATKAAPPGTVLITSEMAQLLIREGAPFSVTRTHEENLKGFEGTTALYTLGRSPD